MFFGEWTLPLASGVLAEPLQEATDAAIADIRAMLKQFLPGKQLKLFEN